MTTLPATRTDPAEGATGASGVPGGHVTVRLEAACGHGTCAELAWRFKRQLDTPNYSRGASVMAMPANVEEWRAEHRTARKRADRAARLGYRFDEIDRSRFNDDIYSTNTSLPERQGRPMSAGYLERHDHGPLPDYACDRHRIETFGVLHGETLVAYLTLYVVGQLRLVSMILGHGSHLDAGIMYLLFQGVVARHAGEDATFYYNRHDSGQQGLAWMKERLGFRATDIEWML